MGIMNWMVSKALGLDTAGDTSAKSLEKMLLLNRVNQQSLKEYKAESSDADPRFHIRTYVGDVSVDGLRQGAIICIDEASGWAWGTLCERSLIAVRDSVYRSYMSEKIRGDYPVGSFGSHFGEEMTGEKFEMKRVGS